MTNETFPVTDMFRSLSWGELDEVDVHGIWVPCSSGRAGGEEASDSLPLFVPLKAGLLGVELAGFGNPFVDSGGRFLHGDNHPSDVGVQSFIEPIDEGDGVGDLGLRSVKLELGYVVGESVLLVSQILREAGEFAASSCVFIVRGERLLEVGDEVV